MPKVLFVRVVLFLCSAFCATPLLASTDQSVASCQQLTQSGVASWVNNNQTLIAEEAAPHRAGRGQAAWRYQASDDQISVVWIVIGDDAENMTALQIETQLEGNPVSQWVLDADCAVRSHKRIRYNSAGVATTLQTLGGDQLVSEQLLNPAVPNINQKTSSVLVALVDSGVNYTLPAINSRLARDKHGALLSKDFWDQDDLPFDSHPSRSAFTIVRHGTRTASILLREAPDAALVAYRYPRPDMSRMTQLVAHAAEIGVAVVGMPLGGNKLDQWQAFADAARLHPEILFIASAGNNGRNIDQQAVYPASLTLDNLLVVTSADDFVRPAERVNWGRVSVDYMLPAENIDAIDFNGSKVKVSGSSYAVPRAVAMAARMIQANPDWRAPELIAEFARLYKSGTSVKYVSAGYIADPLADYSAHAKIEIIADITIDAISNDTTGKHVLPLTVWALGDSWPSDAIKAAIEQASAVLGQCDISIPTLTVQRVNAADHLMDLSLSSAYTLFAKVRPRGRNHPAAIVFARDTAMLEAFDGEAFGRGNTRSRPWMRDSVWLTSQISDAGIGLAHELYHVLANSGAHNQIKNNLMQPYTQPGASELTAEQCQSAIHSAVTLKLIN